MADRGDTHYGVPTLNVWFALSSLLFMVACFWMVIDDWSRPWKQYQREFREIEIARGRAELDSEVARAVVEDERRLAEELEAAEAALQSREEEIAEAKEDLRLKKGEQFNSTEAAKVAKQIFNWERYLVEEHRIHYDDPTYREAELAEYEREFLATAGEAERVDLMVAEAEARLEAMQDAVDEARLALKNAGKSLDLTRSKLARIDPEDAPTQVANLIRDFPGLDFIGPSLKVNKVVLEDLTFELNFTRKKRIDMCTTCHVPIDRAGFENEEQPHQSHPRLDLFLTAKSPHPMNQMGCTICHRGSGEALDFTRADHNTSDEAQGEDWYHDFHWHKQHHWDYPMLREENVEASCVQCHKDTMELIADEAPEVTEGYRNFERFGCYACHKVDWFPTKRRPGPSLRHVGDKTSADFVASWIAAPRDFRPTTWMPQIFHLENFAADEVVVTSEYGLGRDILGQEWNDAAVAAVTAYVMDASTSQDLDPIPVEGDAFRGSEVFRLAGCLACHNMAPFEGESDVRDPALEERGPNEHGPNLRGIATKVTPEWLFHWIKDPAAYWSETRMPDLRLPDQDIADIVAYITEDPDGYFTDVPEDWEVAASPYDRTVLEEQARWFFSRDGRQVIQDRLGADWSDDRALLRAVGEKFILNQGCHSCHEIPGTEDAQPIGAELSNWGSKTVDKLDWGFMADILAEEHGWDQKEKLEYKKYREPWLAQKLAEPRSFDRRKEKNPLEKLKMPWFDFGQEEIASISTFVLGLVDDEVQRAKMVPDAKELTTDHGLRVIRQKNCAACHVIEPGEITFEGEEGEVHKVRAELLALPDEVLPLEMRDLDALHADVESWEEYFEEDLDELGFRLLEPAPGFGEPGSTVFVAPDKIRAVDAPWGGNFVKVVTDYYLNGQELYDAETDEYFYVTADPNEEGAVQDVDGEWRSFAEEPYDKVRWTYAPPVLLAEGHKLQKEWFYEFLRAPVPLRQQMRVKMPTFHYGEDEAGAVAAAFANMAVKAWPSTFARELRLAGGQTVEELAEAADMQPRIVAGIEAGDPVATAANLPDLLAYAESIGFSHSPPVDPDFEAIDRRTPQHVAEAFEEVEGTGMDRISLGHQLAAVGPQCFQCHFYRGEAPAEGSADPIAWAPDLYLTRERLRADWVWEWLWAPGRKYPGTAMPANFSPDPDKVQYTDLYPNSTSGDQINAVLDWLYNADREAVDGLAVQ